MNQEPDNGLLLNDVLAEAASPDFREALLGETLRLARRRRRWRQTRRVAGIIVTLALLGIFVWQNNLPQQPVALMPVAKAKVKSYQLVHTQPLSAGAIVTTRPLSADRFVASAATIETLQTTAGNFRVINDNELLALVASRPAALVRVGPHSEELVFVDPADEKGFPVN